MGGRCADLPMAAYSSVDPVEAAPKYVNTGPAGWGSHAWSDLPDGEAPHRAVLQRIEAAHPEATITLQSAERHEDCVQGSIRYGSHVVWVYFETLRGHLWLWSPERQSAEWARSLIETVSEST